MKNNSGEIEATELPVPTSESCAPPRCPKCKFVMCEQFDTKRINDHADLVTPNGTYICYTCSPLDGSRDVSTEGVVQHETKSSYGRCTCNHRCPTRDEWRNGATCVHADWCEVNTRVRADSAAVEDIWDNEAFGKEMDRWSDAIRDKIIALGVPDYLIDGAGADSGDPLDGTLAEVAQGVAYFADQLEAIAVPEGNEKGTNK